MRLKLLPGLLLAAGLMASTAASAAVVWSGTLAAWEAMAGGVIIDADNDMKFTLFASTTTIPASAGTVVTISESEIGGIDYYDVGLAWTNGWAGGGQLVYTMESINTPERILTVAELGVAVDAAGRISGVISGFDPEGIALRAALDASLPEGARP